MKEDFRRYSQTWCCRGKNLEFTLLAAILLLLTICQMAPAAAAKNDNMDLEFFDSIYVNCPMSKDFIKSFWHTRRYIKKGYLRTGANATTFSRREYFPGLEEVSLDSSARINEDALALLISNFPKIDVLGIRQSEPLSERAIMLLGKFKHLDELDLNCPVYNISLLKEHIPTSIKQLLLNYNDNNQLRFPQMEKLRGLHLNHYADAAFLDGIDAPNLSELLFQKSLSHDAIFKLQKFPNLKSLYIRERISRQDYDYLHTLGIKTIMCTHD